MHLAGLALFGLFLFFIPTGTKVVSHTLTELIASIALVHAWSVPVQGTWNKVSWSVSLEWAAYLSFPAIALATGKLRSTTLIIGAVAGLFFALFLIATSISFRGTMAYGVFRIAAEFTSGVMLFCLWTMRRDTIPAWIAVAALAALIFGASNLETLIGKNSAFVYMTFVSAIVVYSLACAPSVLSGSVLQHLGRMSYSLYIVHDVVLMAVKATIQTYSLAPGWILMGCIVAVALAHVIYVYWEQPTRAWMLSIKQRFGRSNMSPITVGARET